MDQRSTNIQSDQLSSNGQCDSAQAIVIDQTMIGVTSGKAKVRMTCGQQWLNWPVVKPDRIDHQIGFTVTWHTYTSSLFILTHK
ncbi:endonuclease-reverse transcriptase [Plakobranchus ocellatus]|uniref:Endonuclease-reverse transcriptase n=1 Tax=Plakobranchus ocellatus TaxID=259542 RepID=A0AAV3ZEP3_9GAST|nr:endonuclease-reverse transcriptase [Plakobranchus ocellatus]